MRQVFVHDAVLELEPGGDERAPGGAITVALCGSVDHPPPCPHAPHFTGVTAEGSRLGIRVLFATEDEAADRAAIDAALRSGGYVDAEGRGSRWSLVSSAPGVVRDDEREHGARLIVS
jgi:hypothetical protein